MRQLKYTAPGFLKRLARFCERLKPTKEVVAVVSSILETVRRRGDPAILKYMAKFDHVKLSSTDLKVKPQELRAAARSILPQQGEVMKQAIHCVKEFHKHSLPVSWKAKNPHGALVGESYYPLDRVGIYVPGGNVPLVSTVIMTTTLAKLAKVGEIAVFSPPQADGSVNAGLLAALFFCGIEEVYRIGGVQAIGAMAYGSKTVPPVCKVFGPGNAYVIEAKRQVFGTVGVDLLPGPSEVMVIADETAHADYAAADLLAQAEHGKGGKVYLVTTSQSFSVAVVRQMRRQLRTLSHAASIRSTLKQGYLAILVDTLKQAAVVANYIAPEHLELHVDKKQLPSMVANIHHAGAILMGENTPTVLGDFTAGPSHTLPTGRTARYLSGLKLSDFFRRSSIVRYDPRSLRKAWPMVEAFSKLERLDAHGRSLELRLEPKTHN